MEFHYDKSLNIGGLGYEVQVLNSMPKIFDGSGNEMSIHYRIWNGIVQIIVNRSCQDCEEFGKIGDNTLICKKCTYQKDWVRLGLR